MDENFVWCALIFALAYVLRDTLPSYRDLRDMYNGKRIDAIYDAIDDNGRTMLAIGRKVGDLQSDVAGYLTRLDDLEARVEVVERKTKRFGEETP